jgi:pyridoxal biosynthesis lyase PdxS
MDKVTGTWISKKGLAQMLKGGVIMDMVNAEQARIAEEATPADAALMMQLGVDGVFVGSGIFKSGDPAKRAEAIVKATTHFNGPVILAEVSRNLGEPMVGRQISSIPVQELIAGRGW